MRGKINLYSIIGIIYNVLAIILCLILSIVKRNLWINFSFGLYICTLLVNIVLLTRLKHTFFNLPFLFYTLMFLFHLSQIYFAFIGFEDYYCIFTRMEFDVCKKAFTFAFMCIHFSLITYYAIYRHKRIVSNTNSFRISKIDRSLLQGLFIIFFILKVIFRSYWFYVSQVFGYNELLSVMTSIPSLLVMIADVFSILYLKYCCSPKKRKWVLGLIVSLELLFMLSGSRITGITYLLILFLVMPVGNVSKRKVPLKKKILIIIIGVMLGIFLPTISANRLYESRSIFSLNYLTQSNIIDSVIKEFGMSILNTTVIIDNQNNIEFMHGLSYYGSLVSVLPNLGDVFDALNEQFYYTNRLRDFFYYAYGGSNIAEAYINFGIFGVFIFIPAGILLAKLDSVIESFFSHKIIVQLFYVALLYESILWIRGYFFLMIRLPIWTVIIYIVIKSIFSRKKLILKT